MPLRRWGRGEMRRLFSNVALLLLLGACAPRHMHVTDCGFDEFPAPGKGSRVTWTRIEGGGRLEGEVRETGRKGNAVRKAAVLLPQANGQDTLRIPLDSNGAFRMDGLPAGRRKVIVEARWYWAAFDTLDMRADSGLHADVRLEPTPQGWYGCMPH